MEEIVNITAEALRKNGFEVYCEERREDARSRVLSLIGEGQSVGIGGSVTIRDLGLSATLRAEGHPVYWHWEADGRTPAEIFSAARSADVYLASCNAITRFGQLVNIDGTGNRVSSMIQGPGTVILVVGSQKIVDGGMNAAVARIKREACPPNARRLKLSTPCALTGACHEEECGEDCMCNVITVMNRPAGPRTRKNRVVIILVDEVLGC